MTWWRKSIFKRTFASSHQVPYNEPGGTLFNEIKKDKSETDWVQKIYIYFYIGGLAAFAFLWQYKPDSSAQSWARKESLKRMRERGVDLSLFEGLDE